MKYREAQILCRGQEYAMEMPLKSLPRATPDPEQEALIQCKAPIMPVMNPGWAAYPDQEHTEVFVSFIPDGEGKCIYSAPDCANCHIAKVAQSLKSGNVILTNYQYKKGDLSSLKPNI